MFWLPLDLEGFLFYPQLWEGWSITLGLLAPVRMLSSAVALLTAAVEGRAGAVPGGEDAPQASALAATKAVCPGEGA